MVTREIQSDIENIEKDAALYEEINFVSRCEAVDAIEFKVIDRIDGLLQAANPLEGLLSLKQRAERVKRQLEDVDAHLFQRLRADIKKGGYSGTALTTLIDQYVGWSSRIRQYEDSGYDDLDVFINGLLLAQALPTDTKDREPGMMYYQQTPARIIFELAEKAHLTQEDVFYDLGSGLGQVPILMNLLSGAVTKGVEFEPAYCEYASACASDLNLSHVKFIQADARTTDYSGGTVFFMYTPFAGKVLQDVLDNLRMESQKRDIRLFTYGTCTLQVSRQSWLECLDSDGAHIYKLCEFRNSA